MGKKRTKKKPSSPVRGLAVVILAAIVLLGIILFLQRDPSAEAEPSKETIPLSAYGAGDFAYDGDYLTCTAGNAVLGVDVSSHQGTVDWSQVKSAGFEFAMIRVGYRGYTQGSLSIDECAADNLSGAKAAGLQVGAYFFSQAISVEEARKEAKLCIEFLEDYSLDLPLVFDWEYVSGSARTGNMDAETVTACALAFCETVEAAGYEAMIYFNPHIAEEYLDLTQLTAYPFWLALYSDNMTYPYTFEMWQYTDSGSVPGIQGKADINLWIID